MLLFQFLLQSLSLFVGTLCCGLSDGPLSAGSVLDPEEFRLSNPHRSKSCHVRSDLDSGNRDELKNYILTNNPQVSTGL